jgi:hypothetical protein
MPRVRANFAQHSREKFNAIKHHSTRFNISRSCRWNRPAKSHPGETQGSGEEWKLVKAPVTLQFHSVLTACQNLAGGCTESRKMECATSDKTSCEMFRLC